MWFGLVGAGLASFTRVLLTNAGREVLAFLTQGVQGPWGVF